MQYSTGTTNTVMACTSIPPNVGMAIGTMISDPLPVDVKMGNKAISVVAVVMIAGLILSLPACSTASFIPATSADVAGIKDAVLHAGKLRIRPAIMTTATTLIALLPIFTSTGKGSDIMVPMAIPTFGGMLVQAITVFVVPVLYCMWQERVIRKQAKAE